MKIKLSKSQWEAVGRKAGWIKKANDIPEMEEDFYKVFDGKNGYKYYYSLPIGAEAEDTAQVLIYAEWDRGQVGGYDDPSWPPHWELERVVEKQTGIDLTDLVDKDEVETLLNDSIGNGGDIDSRSDF